MTPEAGAANCLSVIVSRHAAIATTMPMNTTQPTFPSSARVAAEEASRFREASPAERMRAIRSTLAAGALLIARSPKREFLESCRQQQEEAAREAIAQFVHRHAARP